MDYNKTLINLMINTENKIYHVVNSDDYDFTKMVSVLFGELKNIIEVKNGLFIWVGLRIFKNLIVSRYFNVIFKNVVNPINFAFLSIKESFEQEKENLLGEYYFGNKPGNLFYFKKELNQKMKELTKKFWKFEKFLISTMHANTGSKPFKKAALDALENWNKAQNYILSFPTTFSLTKKEFALDDSVGFNKISRSNFFIDLLKVYNPNLIKSYFKFSKIIDVEILKNNSDLNIINNYLKQKELSSEEFKIICQLVELLAAMLFNLENITINKLDSNEIFYDYIES